MTSTSSSWGQWNWTSESQYKRMDTAIKEALQNNRGAWVQPLNPEPSLTRSRIQKLIEEGHVLKNGKIVKSKDSIEEGDEIQLKVPPLENLEALPEDIPVEILYEDEHLLVVNKPPGLTVHPSETQKSGTLVNALLHKVDTLSGIGGVLRPGIVHRIDKGTSGALVVTKSDAAHQKLSETFSKHDLERKYWALVYGNFPHEEKFRHETLIARNPRDRKKMTTKVDEGKVAISYFKRLETYGDPAYASLVEATLKTGRTHQVRVHLTQLGHGLLGDPIYGAPSASQQKWKSLPTKIKEILKPFDHQALHAKILKFPHPITGKEISIDAPFPKDFENLLNSLKKDKL